MLTVCMILECNFCTIALCKFADWEVDCLKSASYADVYVIINVNCITASKYLELEGQSIIIHVCTGTQEIYSNLNKFIYILLYILFI